MWRRIENGAMKYSAPLAKNTNGSRSSLVRTNRLAMALTPATTKRTSAMSRSGRRAFDVCSARRTVAIWMNSTTVAPHEWSSHTAST